jgi:integrase/recombinase XerC
MSKPPKPMDLSPATSAVLSLLDVDPSPKVTTKKTYRRAFTQFLSFASGTGCVTTLDLNTDVAMAWVNSWGINNKPAAQNTRRLRRTTLRYLFSYLRALGAYEGDPLLDTPEIARVIPYARPLADGEMRLCETRCSTVDSRSSVPATLAVAQAGAGSIEVSSVIGAHVDLEAGTIELSGSVNRPRRVVPLTAWGVQVLADRLQQLGDPSASVAFQGGTDASSLTSISGRLRKVLIRAGLSDLPGVEVRSIRYWAGLRAFNETGLIEDAARVLGDGTLEATALHIGHPWRDEV